MSSVPPPGYILATARLGLRPYRAADAAFVEGLFADAQAARFYPAMHDPLRIERWIAWNLKNYEEHGFGLWAVELLTTGQFIGDAGLTMQTIDGVPEVEIGYHLHADHRGSGYATEAASACLVHAWAHTRANVVCSVVHPDNTASAKVARRVHASMREFEWHSGRHLLFSTSRAQAPSAKS